MPRRNTPSNLLLSALPPTVYNKISPLLERVPLTFSDVLYEVGGKIKWIYFPESGMVSLLSGVGQSAFVEVGIVGREGIVGVSVFLDADKIAGARTVVRCRGSALRMKTSDLLKECRRSDALPKLLRQFAGVLIRQISQSSACNRFHSVDARLAKWLLITHDQTQEDDLEMTQGMLSEMLGVRREAVTRAAASLRRLNVIEYSRSRMKVLDRPALETRACICYRSDRLLRNAREHDV